MNEVTIHPNILCNDPKYITLPTPIKITDNITCIGYYPYSVKRIQGTKISNEFFRTIIMILTYNRITNKENPRIVDNKVVWIFQDTNTIQSDYETYNLFLPKRMVNSTKYFGIFHHDGTCTIGDEIQDH